MLFNSTMDVLDGLHVLIADTEQMIGASSSVAEVNSTFGVALHELKQQLRGMRALSASPRGVEDQQVRHQLQLLARAAKTVCDNVKP